MQKVVSTLLVLLFLFTSCEEKERSREAVYLFYQPLLKDQKRIEWREVFSTMHSLGMGTLILQWSRYGVVDFMKQKVWLEKILKEAKARKIKVVIGLYGDKRYFKNIENKKLNLSVYFDKLHKINLQQAKQVYKVAKAFPNFSGWYLTEEVDDLNFKDKAREEALKIYWKRVSKEIKKVANRPIYLSGFYGQNSSPEAYATMLKSIIPKDAHLLLQSGVGAKLVALEESRDYMQKFKMSYRSEFIPIVELFTIDKKEIKTMEFKMIRKQIELFKESNISKNIALFSLRYLFVDDVLEAYKKGFR